MLLNARLLPSDNIELTFSKVRSCHTTHHLESIHSILSPSSEIIFQSQNSTTKLPDLLLVCSFKHYQDLSLLHLIFPPSGISVSDISKLKLRIEAYVTRDNEPQTTTSADGNHVKTKWFKPNNKDSPISPVLGPNNLLWLGVVILTSFTMFLLLIANVTRYYMYPVDLTVIVYNFTYRSVGGGS
ncbi:hypothetical protein YC2023_002704 [Brassica napus]